MLLFYLCYNCWSFFNYITKLYTFGNVVFTIGLDFSLLNSTVQFTPNDLTQRIYFYINNDGIVEYAEQFSLGLVSSDPSLSVVGSSSVDIQIGSDDRKTFISNTHTIVLVATTIIVLYNNHFNVTFMLFSLQSYMLLLIKVQYPSWRVLQ